MDFFCLLQDKLLDLCKSISLRIANGRLSSDNGIGTCTYASRAGCSVIDYVILDKVGFCCMNDFKIHPYCELAHFLQGRVCVPTHQAPFVKGVHCKRKEFVPTAGKFFSFRSDTFPEGKIVLEKLPSLNEYQFAIK